MMHPVTKIALFGGTFDPIHNGHLAGVISVADSNKIDRVFVIPSRIPPHRQLSGNATATQRYEMVKLACEQDPRLIPCDFEIEKKGKSYSVDTIDYFLADKNLCPEGKVNFIIGTDAFAEIDTWRKAERLFEICNFIVMVRPGFDVPFEALLPEKFHRLFPGKPNEDVHLSLTGNFVKIEKINGINLSSTQIREKIAKKEAVASLLPEKVQQYIRRHKLYGS